MNKHTPGPWRDVITVDGGLVVYITEPPDPEKPYNQANFLFFGDMEDTTADDHANAKLVAAAPELLEACESDVRALERITAIVQEIRAGDTNARNALDIIFDLADTDTSRAAIAKARGE